MGKNTEIEVDLVIGADGANSRVAKEIGAGEYDYAIAFQVSPAGRHTIDCSQLTLRASLSVSLLGIK